MQTETLPKAGERTQPILNGNKFVKTRHIFIQNVGCYFPTMQEAVKEGTSPNGVGLWSEELIHGGETFFRAGNLNVWN